MLTCNTTKYLNTNSTKWLFIVSLIILSLSANAQITRIRGVVYDKETNDPIPFVNVALKGTTIGTTTGFSGEFFLETRIQSSVLLVSYIGYQPYEQTIMIGSYQELRIYLQPETIELNEVVVTPGENPAHRILREINNNKERNNPNRFEKYQYEVYNKMELDINNFSEDLKNSAAFRPFQFVFDYVDTSAITGKTFLPVFITETLSDFYYQKKPTKRKEIIKASKISGVDSDRITEFTGQMYLDFNIYDNLVPIMGKDLVSPIASYGLMYYKYYLIDSAYIDNRHCYQISFQPKRKQEPTFTGYFWVHDTTYAIQRYKIRMSEDINLNFVTEFVAEQSYTYVNDSAWFPQEQDLFIDFGITNKEYGFFGRKNTSYHNINLNPYFSPDFFSAQFAQETETLDNASSYSQEEWNKMRHDSLSEREANIYEMVDSIQGLPIYNTIVDLVTMFITGYYVHGPIEIGPYYTLFSFNPIEGARFKLGLRTSNAFSTKIMLKGHIAYGTLDNKVKYGLGTQYMFNKMPRRAFYADYLRDYELLGVSENAFLSDNFLSSILARKQNDKLTTVNNICVSYEHEWFQGFSNTIKARYKEVYASEQVPFQTIINTIDTVDVQQIATTELTLNTRLAFNEKFLLGEFERMSLGTKYPILQFRFSTGIPQVFGGDYEYYKLKFSIEHKFPVHTFGDFQYIVDIGQVLGNVPFPFLQIHEGNQTFAYDKYAFNLMNYYEFVSDRYATVMIEQHFNGLFLNHIPLMRKLKWREIAGFKILMGDIAQRHDEMLLFPVTLDNLKSRPYMEAGLGVENIFKFFRVDAVWRLSYLENPDILPFGLLAVMQLKF